MQETKIFFFFFPPKSKVRLDNMENEGKTVLGRVKRDSQKNNWNCHAWSNFSVEEVSKEGPLRAP